MPDFMLLASFVADCVFVVLAPHTENVRYVWPILKETFVVIDL